MLNSYILWRNNQATNSNIYILIREGMDHFWPAYRTHRLTLVRSYLVLCYYHEQSYVREPSTSEVDAWNEQCPLYQWKQHTHNYRYPQAQKPTLPLKPFSSDIYYRASSPDQQPVNSQIYVKVARFHSVHVPVSRNTRLSTEHRKT